MLTRWSNCVHSFSAIKKNCKRWNVCWYRTSTTTNRQKLYPYLLCTSV